MPTPAARPQLKIKAPSARTSRATAPAVPVAKRAKPPQPSHPHAAAREKSRREAPVTPAVAPTKQAQLITALRTAAGATIAELIALTGWQAHTLRGTMSGVLRKRLGLTVTCEARDPTGQRLYRIQSSAGA